MGFFNVSITFSKTKTMNGYLNREYKYNNNDCMWFKVLCTFKLI